MRPHIPIIDIFRWIAKREVHMAKRETNLKAPQFGVGGHLRTNSDKETTTERKESQKDVRAPDMVYANATRSFWYPNDVQVASEYSPIRICIPCLVILRHKRRCELFLPDGRT